MARSYQCLPLPGAGRAGELTDQAVTRVGLDLLLCLSDELGPSLVAIPTACR
ncbi:hypothetical protein [Glutamicibacter sp. TV12E]|uniref:hypothetical protein n=1 Tax=Glutamicibacter sp. TV12E TaxID=3446362 RepID=UPI00403419F9